VKVKQAWGVLLLAGVVAALAGCGGGSGGGSTSTSAAQTAGPSTATTPKQRATTTAPRIKPATGPGARQYERKMQVLGDQLSTFFTKIGNADAKAGRKQVVVNLRRVQVRLRRAGVELGEITPPPTVAAAHRQLIAAVREYADELSGIIADVKGGDRAALAKISQLRGVVAMGKATQAIVGAGYDILGNGRPTG
jgi:hypothetical protein